MNARTRRYARRLSMTVAITSERGRLARNFREIRTRMNYSLLFPDLCHAFSGRIAFGHVV
jgi:hypothetical protein